MQAGISPARQSRARYRHELRTLTYVTFDKANGGVIRNLTHEGIGAQMVAAVRPQQQLQLRFELRYPRLRVETRGEVVWATFSGQCGIRFLDLSPRLVRQINEWILANLLEGSTLLTAPSGAIFANSPAANVRVAEEDGLVLSPTPLKIIKLPSHDALDETATDSASAADSTALDWLSQPLSGRGIAWMVNALAVFAGFLLFAAVFLSVTGETPRFPVAMTTGAACIVGLMYWGFFQMFGGSSLGTRLARFAGSNESEREQAARFR